MTWTHYLYDTTTGLLGSPIDLPAFQWSVSVSDSTLSTTRDKGVGEDDVSGLKVPWSAVPGSTPAARNAALMAGKRSIVSMWRPAGADPSSPGIPIVTGCIEPRTDTWNDTSFSLLSTMQQLAYRIVVPEGRFGMDEGGTSRSSITVNGSYRAIACEAIRLATSAKPGGALPIDLPYAGEDGTRTRTWATWNVQNLSCLDVLTKLSNVQAGPDMQFRPYLADAQHVRQRFVAASDGDVYLGQDVMHSLRAFPGGGDVDDLTITRAAPIQRVYMTGAGTDEATLCTLAEDRTLIEMMDPWPLRESAKSDTDLDNIPLLTAHATATLNANSRPLMQASCTIDIADEDASGSPLHPLGSFWPGELFTVSISSYPSLPDGDYLMRLMQMKGDETSTVKLVFDIMDDPIY